MADYTAKGRTNYFLVKDVAALKADLVMYGITPHPWSELIQGASFILDESPTNKPVGAIALFSDGVWPSLDEDAVADRLGLDDESENAIPQNHASLAELVADHLVDDQVAIFMEVGSQKMSFLGGFALAINSAKESKSIDLEQIYSLAAQLTPTPLSITAADR